MTFEASVAYVAACPGCGQDVEWVCKGYRVWADHSTLCIVIDVDCDCVPAAPREEVLELPPTSAPAIYPTAISWQRPVGAIA